MHIVVGRQGARSSAVWSVHYQRFHCIQYIVYTINTDPITSHGICGTPHSISRTPVYTQH